MPHHRFNSLPITPYILFGCAVMSFYDTNLSEVCNPFSVHPYRRLLCALHHRNINAQPRRAERSWGDRISLSTRLPDGRWIDASEAVVERP